jgi:hypothetical protein
VLCSGGVVVSSVIVDKTARQWDARTRMVHQARVPAVHGASGVSSSSFFLCCFVVRNLERTAVVL